MKRIVSFILILTLLMVFTVGGYAEEIQQDSGSISLSLEEAIDLAIENSLDVSTSEMNYQLAILDSNEKKDAYDSYDDYVVEFGKSGSIENQMIALMTRKGYNYQLSLTTENYSEKAIEYTKNDVESHMISLYYNILYSLEDIKIKETALVRAEDTYRDTSEKYELGRIAKNVLDMAEYSLQNVTMQLENARLDYENYIVEFNIATGIDIDKEIVLSSGLEYEIFSSDLTTDEMLQNSLNKNSQYQNAVYGYDYYTQYCDLMGSGLSDTDFGREAYANQVIAKNNVKAIENQMQLSVIQTINGFKQLENNIELSNRNIEEIKKKINQQELKYEMGLCTFDDVLAQYDDLDSAEVSLLNLVKTYCETSILFNNSIEEIIQ